MTVSPVPAQDSAGDPGAPLGAKPGNLAPTARADIGSAPRFEETLNQIMEVGWSRLLMPFRRECGCSRVISGQSLEVHAITWFYLKVA